MEGIQKAMKEIAEIKTLAERGDLDTAMDRCNRLLDASPSSTADLLRLRAYLHALAGHYAQAVADREDAFEKGADSIRDYYLAADNALSAGHWEKAANWFGQVLKLGEKENETWFRAASFFLLAYAKMELQQFSSAREALSRAIEEEPDISMPVPGLYGMVSSDQLSAELSVREKTSRKR